MPAIDNAKILFREANTAFKLGDLESAAGKYKRLIDGDEPTRGFAAYNLDIINSIYENHGGASLTSTMIPDHLLNDAHTTKQFLYEKHLQSGNKLEVPALRQLGAALLGPIIAAYYSKLRLHLDQNKEIKKLYFLAREGFVLEHVYDKLKKLNLIKSIDTSYLLCSRTLLFKLCLSRRKLWGAVLEHHYSGSLRSLLSDRFQFTSQEIENLCDGQYLYAELDSKNLVLPRDSSIVIDFFTACETKLTAVVEPKAKAYLNYLKKIGFGKRKTEHVVDIGYAGTIQKLLGSLTGKKTVGHYFITTKKAYNTSTSFFIGHLLSNQEFGNEVPILDRSLFIESMLTAPHGQVVDVKETINGTEFNFGKKTAAQLNYDQLFEIIEGATQYAIRALDHDCTMSSEELNSYYGRFVSTPYIFPECARELFEIDDSISGLGTLNPIDFFKA